ncbi:arylalkylamine N-acetyltransferase-like 2 [Lycorma delicatula]|uniref:arylalkylamine N-acetyltransferase-like 2 n=1 Tax=Lycorma delicatula TaxID=130591 RepID=UPI003F511D85
MITQKLDEVEDDEDKLEFAPKEIAVVQGRVGQKELIRKFLKQYYLRDDPVLVAAGLNKSNVLLDFFTKNIKEEIVLLAINPKSGRVLGVACNIVVYPDTAKKIKEEAAKEIKDDPAYRMVCFFADVTEKAKLFERFGINETFDCSFLATHPSIRKKGVGKYLVLSSRELARSIGYPLFRIDCTSIFSSRIACKMQMEKLPTRQFADYVDTKGTPWITAVPGPPNNKLEVYFDRLCPNLCTNFPLPPPQPKKKKRGWF